MKNWNWVLFVVFIPCVLCGNSESTTSTNNNRNQHELRGIFSPRMDYDQWKPLGRGDPLKNDPTYDYVPPVLDRVHYWVEPALRKPDPPLPEKTEILLLGVASKKPSTGTSSAISSSSSVADSRKDSYDSFLKFVDAPKFNNPHHPHFNHNHYQQRISRPQFQTQGINFQSQQQQQYFNINKSKVQSRNEQRVPYTMLMPPPLFDYKKQTPQTTTTSKTPFTMNPASSTNNDVTVQESNLIYQSSTSGWNYQLSQDSSLGTLPPHFTTEKSAFQKGVVYPKRLQSLPESYIKIQFAPHKNYSSTQLISAENSDINFVTVPPIMDTHIGVIGGEVMHKGQVSDGKLDISNTYVKIGKTEAQVHSTAIDNMDESMAGDLIVFPSMVQQQQQQRVITQSPIVTLQMMHTVKQQQEQLKQIQQFKQHSNQQEQTVTTASDSIWKQQTANSVLDALEAEKITTTTESVSTPTTVLAYPLSSTTIKPEPITTQTYSTSTFPTQSLSSAATTPTASALTTDSLFKHYKQPSEPLRGPLYLIIQGHSKVKTYGPSKRVHGIMVQDTNDIGGEEGEEFRGFGRAQRGGRSLELIRGNYRISGEGEGTAIPVDSGGLQTLKHVIETRLGGLDFAILEDAPKSSRSLKPGGDLKKLETELRAGYEVGDGKDVVTSENYRKGIIVEGMGGSS